MRELPLPGASDTANRRDFKHTKPAPRADNGLSSRSDASANDAARRGSGKEASTSSSGSVTFQPPQQSSLARTNGAALRQTQRRSDNNTYDATIAVNQAAPGFTAASRSAVAATEQRAESLIDAGQSKLLCVRHYLHAHILLKTLQANLDAQVNVRVLLQACLHFPWTVISAGQGIIITTHSEA